MSAVVKGTPTAAAAATVTLPAHAVGDLIVIYAFRDGSNTVPSKPAASGTVPAWVDIDATTGANTCSCRTAQFVATATNHTSGTWTSATGMSAAVITGHLTSGPIGGHALGGGTGANTATAPAVTMSDTSGASALLHFYGNRTVTAWAAAPAGYTRRASVATEVALNTKDSTTADGAIAQTCTATSSGWRCATVEVLTGPLIGDLTDDFSTADAAKWNGLGTNPSVTGGRLSLASTAGYVGIDSVGRYNLTASAMTVEFVQRAISTANSNVGLIDEGGNNRLAFGVSGTSLKFVEVANGTPDETSVTYNATNHRWLRIRESGGTVYWETSADGTSWSTGRSKSWAVGQIGNLKVFADCGGVDDVTTPALYDNFNLPPSGMTGTAAAVLQYALFAGTGGQAQSGTAAATLQKATAALSGVMQPTGTIAAALQYALFAGAGAQAQSGVVAALLQQAAMAAAGAQTQSGTAAAALSAATMSASGFLAPSGSIAVTTSRTTAALLGEQAQTGALTASTQPTTAALSGVGQATGTIAASTPVTVFAGAGSHVVQGTIATTIQVATMTATGAQIQSGTIAATLRYAVAAVVGVMQPSGTISATLQYVTLTGSGSGAGNTTLPFTLPGTLSPDSATTGTMASALQRTTFAATGLQAQSGTVAVAISAATFIAAGVQTQSGVIAASMQRILFAGVAVPPSVTGTIGATVPAPTAAASGAMPAQGQLAATLHALLIAVLAVPPVDWPDEFTILATTRRLTLTGPTARTLAATTTRRTLDADRDDLALTATTRRLTLED